MLHLCEPGNARDSCRNCHSSSLCRTGEPRSSKRWWEGTPISVVGWKKSHPQTPGIYIYIICKNPVNDGRNYQPQLVIAGFLPSTVVRSLCDLQNKCFEACNKCTTAWFGREDTCPWGYTDIRSTFGSRLGFRVDIWHVNMHQSTTILVS